jgi:hypothetical protein
MRFESRSSIQCVHEELAMGYGEEVRFESASRPSLRGPDVDGEGTARPWRAPVITRLSVERTLFNTGSPTDLGGFGSTGG